MATDHDDTESQSPRRRGRPEGSTNKLAREARAKAQATGLLPHEIMLSIARGEPQIEYVSNGDGTVKERVVNVDLDTRLDAAKAAAPYYAPKISTVEVISGVSDADLDAIIARAAAEAGVSLGPGGASTEAEATETGASAPAPHGVRGRRERFD